MLLHPSQYDAIIVDLEGVVTDTAAVHQAAWRHLFDSVLRHRSRVNGTDYRHFTMADYLAYIDGKSQYDGTRDFLASCGIVVPFGTAADPPERETVCGLANRKDVYFIELLATRGVRVFDSTVRLVTELRRRGLGSAVVSGSRNCRTVLAAAGLCGLFPVRVDGIDAERLSLPGVPDPAIFLEAARRLGTAPGRAIVVDDAEAGVAAGIRGGFGLVIGVDRIGTSERLLACGAHVVISDLRQVDLTPTDPTGTS